MSQQTYVTNAERINWSVQVMEWGLNIGTGSLCPFRNLDKTDDDAMFITSIANTKLLLLPLVYFNKTAP